MIFKGELANEKRICFIAKAAGEEFRWIVHLVPSFLNLAWWQVWA